MTIIDNELINLKSTVVTDTDANGALMDNNAVVTSGVVNNMWPNVFKAERTAGSVKYRKSFWKVANDADETLFNPQVWLDAPTVGDDWVTLFAGTQTDIQSDISGAEDHYGCASLNADVSAGVSVFTVVVEDAVLVPGGADEIFRDGESIRITDMATPTSGTGTEEFHTINGTPTVSGLEVTITIDGTLANPYTTADNTRIMSVYEPADIVGAHSNLVGTTAGDGAYDDTTYPPLLDNIGTINQEVTLTFTDAINFTAVSNVAGVTLAAGAKNVDYLPSNPDVTKPYFTLETAGFSGTWAASDTIVFNTAPASIAIWQKRTVPAGADSLTGNKVTVVFGGESS